MLQITRNRTLFSPTTYTTFTLLLPSDPRASAVSKLNSQPQSSYGDEPRLYSSGYQCGKENNRGCNLTEWEKARRSFRGATVGGGACSLIKEHCRIVANGSPAQWDNVWKWTKHKNHVQSACLASFALGKNLRRTRVQMLIWLEFCLLGFLLSPTHPGGDSGGG